MPPEKEVNFFTPPPPSWWRRNFRAHTIRNDAEWERRYRDWSAAKSRGESGAVVDWYRRYLFAARTAANYRKLFHRPPGKISGDISPTYANMSAREVARAARAAPDAKIVYLLRDPIERAWSGFRMHNAMSAHGVELATAPVSDIIARIKAYDDNHGCYSAALDRWERHYKNRVRVWFYEEIRDEPERMFSEVCDYLGIAVNLHFDHNKIHEKVHDGAPAPLPDGVRRYYVETLKDEIVALHRRFDNRYTRQWLDNLSKP